MVPDLMPPLIPGPTPPLPPGLCLLRSRALLPPRCPRGRRRGRPASAVVEAAPSAVAVRRSRGDSWDPRPGAQCRALLRGHCRRVRSGVGFNAVDGAAHAEPCPAARESARILLLLRWPEPIWIQVLLR
jgi:hypothetical protein